MSVFSTLHDLAENNDGILLTKDVVSAGISKTSLAAFVKELGYERVSHGIYCAPDCWRDDMYLLQLRCPSIIFSHDTALYLHDMTDRDPLNFSVTVKTGYNPSALLASGVNVFSIKRDFFEIGVSKTTTPFGHFVSTYDPERTVCDVLRSRNSMDIQSVQDALKRYVLRKDRDLHKLMEFASVFHVEKRLSRYMEVLL